MWRNTTITGHPESHHAEHGRVILAVYNWMGRGYKGILIYDESVWSLELGQLFDCVIDAKNALEAVVASLEAGLNTSRRTK